METKENIQIGDTVLYPDCYNGLFKVEGVRERELEIVGDFSGVGHEQKSWVGLGKLVFHKAKRLGNAKILLDQLRDAMYVLDYVLNQGYSENIDKDYDQLNLCHRLVDGHTIVVSAFPGTGKSHFFENSTLSVLDSDSSKFDKAHFPANYIEHIKSNIGKADIIFVSSHKVVRDALVEAGIDFALVYPNVFAKEEYIERYKKRGSPESFIKLISDNWDNWLDEIKEQKGCFRYCLQAGKYLSDLK